jgi:hypothetical protein
VKDNLLSVAVITAGIVLLRLVAASTPDRWDFFNAALGRASIVLPPRPKVRALPSATSGRPRPCHRPLGITLLAILYLTGGAWTLVAVILAKVEPNALSPVLRGLSLDFWPLSSLPHSAFLTGFLALVRVPLSALGMLTVASMMTPTVFALLWPVLLTGVGIGMWQLKNGARVSTVVIAAYELAAELLLLAAGLIGHGPSGGPDIGQAITSVVRLGTSLGVICYLVTPAVKQAFQQA